MVVAFNYKSLAAVALFVSIVACKDLGQTKHPLVGCYSIVGDKNISLHVAQKENKIHMALGYERTTNIFIEQTLAHEMNRKELIKKGGFKGEDIDKFASNLMLNDCGSCYVGVVQIKPGEVIDGFEEIAPHIKGRTSYFAFLGIVGTWVNKVDCP